MEKLLNIESPQKLQDLSPPEQQAKVWTFPGSTKGKGWRSLDCMGHGSLACPTLTYRQYFNLSTSGCLEEHSEEPDLHSGACLGSGNGANCSFLLCSLSTQCFSNERRKRRLQSAVQVLRQSLRAHIENGKLGSKQTDLLIYLDPNSLIQPFPHHSNSSIFFY